MSVFWQVSLLGKFSWERPGQLETVRRFRTQKTAALLAFLTLHKAHPPFTRERLIDLFWTDAEIEAGRHNLSNALTSLRHQLEPPDIPPGTVLQTDRNTVALVSAAIETDVARFEQAAARAEIAVRNPAVSNSERASLLKTAVQAYTGPLLPGFYDDWAVTEAQRLSLRFMALVRLQIPLLLEAGEGETALLAARQLTELDADQETHIQLMIRSLVAVGQKSQARQIYRDWERKQTGASSSEAMKQLARWLYSASAKPLSHPMPDPVDQIVHNSSTEEPAKTDVIRETEPPINRLHGNGFLLLSLNRFFGRETEQTQIAQLLTDVTPPRLLTILGTGGVGKTRFSLEMARYLTTSPEDELSPRSAQYPPFAHAVFVPLADLPAPERIPDAILLALTVTQHKGDGLTQAKNSLNKLAHSEKETGRVLLILDNLEHLTENTVTGDILTALLQDVATLTILTTSRQPLHLEGEHLFPLEPLPLIGTGLLPLTVLAKQPGIQLFVDRARAVRPDFQLTSANAETLITLTDGLEGIPLAIELAAARVQTLTPAQMHKQLAERRFHFLVGRKRNVSLRHKTLYDTIAWSYRLLPEAVARFFARLSVFRGSWTVESATTVCGEPQAADYLELLCESSLIYTQTHEPETRYRMLETLREFAEAQLTPDEHSTLEQAHDTYFHRMALESQSLLQGAAQQEGIARLTVEWDNLRAVLRRACNTQRADFGLEIGVALGTFFQIGSHFQEGEQWLEELLAFVELSTEAQPDSGQISGKINQEHTPRLILYADTLYRIGVLAQTRADLTKARRVLRQALALREQVGDVRGIANTLNTLGNVAYIEGDHTRAREFFEQGLALARQANLPRESAATLNNLGNLALSHHDYDTAQRAFEECLLLRREMGDLAKVAVTLNNIGNLATDQKDFAVAAAYYAEALVLHHQMGNRSGILRVLFNRGRLHYIEGQHAQALLCFRDGFQMADTLFLPTVVAAGLEYTAAPLIACGRPDLAARFLGAAAQLRDTNGIAGGGETRTIITKTQEAARHALGEEAYTNAFEAGQRLTWQAVVALLPSELLPSDNPLSTLLTPNSEGNMP